jgi:PAS domain S-box-containing protein
MQPPAEPSTPVRRPRPRSYYTRISLVAPLFLWFLLISAVEISVYQEQRSAHSSELRELGDSANEVRTLFEYELNATLHLTSGLIAYIQAKNGQLVERELAPWLSHLQERSPHIRNIAIAPGNRIEFIYPLKDNEAALGFYYPSEKTQWPLVEKTILSRRPILAGPLELRQGGQGMLYRVPVYLGDKDYWGLISTVLKSDDIFLSIANRAEQLGIKVAIEDQDEGRRLITGDHFAAQHSLTLRVPGRNWQLLASALKPQVHSFFYTRLAGWLVACASSLLLYSLLRSLAIQQATSRALDESKYRFTQAFNSAPQGMALIAPTGELLDVNDSLSQILDYSRSDLQRLNLFDLVPLDRRERLRQSILNRDAASKRQYESLLLARDGKLLNVLLSLAPTQSGSDSEWILQISDISQRVAFEHLLKEEAEYNQAIFNGVLDGILIIDRSGTICLANPAAGKTFGCDFHHLHQVPLRQLIADSTGDIMARFKYLAGHPDAPDKSHHEMRGTKADGQEFPLELQLSSIIRKQEKLFIVLVRDISERKRLERMKNEFVSIISHELRTPLTAVLGTLRLLAGGALSDKPDQAAKAIKIADQNGQKLARLIDDLLDMDKLLAGKMQFDFTIQALYPLVLESIELNAAYAAQHQVQIQLESQDEHIMVEVDRDRFQQIMANLLSNAAKFSAPNTKVSVTIKTDNNRVQVAVTDRGIGIPQSLQDALFQKFYQVDSSNTRQKGGTGLGLAIARQLIEAMHGNVGLISEEGKGSSFFIDLPIAQPTVAANG